MFDWFRRRRLPHLESDLRREIQSHLELEAEELRDRGTPEQEARWAARRAFGNITRTEEEVRRMWGIANFAAFQADLVYGARTLRRSPAFALGAILCLAIGIGASTAIFSIVNSVIMRPLPYRDSGRLVRVYTEFPTFPNGGLRRFAVSAPEFREMQRDGKAWDQLESWVTGGANLGGGGDPVRVTACFVSGGMMALLGVEPRMGRWVSPQDDAYGAPVAVVLSDGLWKRAFGGDANVIGRQVLLDGDKATVVGIMPPGFNFPPGAAEPAELWVPQQLTPQTLTQRDGHFLSLIAHMRPGASLEQVRDETNALVSHYGARRAEKFHTIDPETHPLVVHPFAAEVSASVRKPVLTLFGAVGFFLLIACVNVANLLLARASSREREMAVRKAIGASSPQLVRQLVAEGTLLSALGALFGLALAWAALRVIVATNAGMIPRIQEVGIDWRVIAFSVALALLTGVVFGLAPMAHLVLRPLNDALRSSAGRVQGSTGANRFRSALVALELSLALVLLIGAGLLVQAFWKLQRVYPGFEGDNVLTARLSLSNSNYQDGAKIRAFWANLTERLHAIPGADAVSMATGIPPERQANENDTAIENFAPRPGGPIQSVAFYNYVSPGYFETIRARLVDGRYVEPRDTAEAPQVVVINQAMARTFWPGESAIGKRIVPGDRNSDKDWVTVVGVVEDIKNGGLDKPARTEIFLPAAQSPSPFQTAYVFVRGRGDVRRFASAVRSMVREVDAAVPVAQVRTMEEVISKSQSRPQFLAMMLTVFSGLALALAAFGIYGVIAYSVSQRTTELGIRMALGAQRSRVLGLVLREGLVITAAGSVLGFFGATLLTRSLEGLLFEVSRMEPAVFIAMAATLALVALAACFAPAWRATRIDPIRALHYE